MPSWGPNAEPCCIQSDVVMNHVTKRLRCIRLIHLRLGLRLQHTEVGKIVLANLSVLRLVG